MRIPIKKVLTIIITIIAISAFGIVFARAFFYYPSDEIYLPEDVDREIIQEIVENGGGTVVIKANIAIAKKANFSAIEKPVSAPAITMRLTIPKIGIDAKVQEVGITSKGAMAAPRNFFQVGWYKYGAYPGETGSAVMAGHVDNGIALPAVFHDLPLLEIGDDIYIETKDGKKLHFKVSGQSVHDFDTAPAEVFNESGGKFLKLITCTGSWIKELRTHDKRLIIKATLVE